MIRVIIADDSFMYRRMLTDTLNQAGDFEVIGTARTGEEAVLLAKALKPDAMTLDVEMPGIGGLGALKLIMAESPVPTIMISSHTGPGATQTLEALELGAVDFLCKSGPEGVTELRKELPGRLRQLSAARTGSPKIGSTVSAGPSVAKSDKILLVASSTGGPGALTSLFNGIPFGLPIPIIVVQHMPIGFTAPLADRLNRLNRVPVKEAVQGQALLPGQAMVAPGGTHLAFDPHGRVQLLSGEAVNGVKPAADITFKSAAKVFGGRCVGAILTGMGKDGAEGAVAVRQVGGMMFGESESTCVVYGMPRAAKLAGGIDIESPIHELGAAIVRFLNEGKVARAV